MPNPERAPRLIDLGLSVRAQNVVTRALADAGHITLPATVMTQRMLTLAEVCLLSEDELGSTRGCGTKTLQEVREALERRGLSLQTDSVGKVEDA